MDRHDALHCIRHINAYDNATNEEKELIMQGLRKVDKLLLIVAYLHPELIEEILIDFVTKEE